MAELCKQCILISAMKQAKKSFLLCHYQRNGLRNFWAWRPLNHAVSLNLNISPYSLYKAITSSLFQIGYFYRKRGTSDSKLTQSLKSLWIQILLTLMTILNHQASLLIHQRKQSTQLKKPKQKPDRNFRRLSYNSSPPPFSNARNYNSAGFKWPF